MSLATEDRFLALLSPSGHLKSLSFDQYDVKHSQSRSFSPEVQKNETSMPRDYFVSLLCMSRDDPDTSANKASFSRVHTQGSVWYGFTRNGHICFLEDCAAYAGSLVYFPPWNIHQPLHAAYPVELKSPVKCPESGSSLLMLENDPLELQVRSMKHHEPLITFRTNMRTGGLRASSIIYVEASKHSLSHTDCPVYSPLIVLSTNNGFLGALCPQSQNYVWTARRSFSFKNIRFSLSGRIMDFCVIPARPLSTTDVLQKLHDNSDHFLCCITKDRFLLVYHLLQRLSPISVIYMSSLSGEPRCISYAGRSSVVVADTMGVIVRADVTKSLERYLRGKSAEWSSDESFTTTLQTKGQSGIQWLVPVPITHQVGSREKIKRWLDIDCSSCYNTCLCSSFFVHGLDGSVRVLVTWKSDSGRSGNSHSVCIQSLREIIPISCSIFGFGQRSLNDIDENSEVNRLIRSRQVDQPIGDFIESNYAAVNKVLGWSTLEVRKMDNMVE